MMPKKQTDKAGSKSPSEAPSPEYVAFEELAKKVLRVPKTELDQREAEYKESRKPNAEPN